MNVMLLAAALNHNRYWDEQSFSVVCHISFPASPVPPLTLARKLSRALTYFFKLHTLLQKYVISSANEIYHASAVPDRYVSLHITLLFVSPLSSFPCPLHIFQRRSIYDLLYTTANISDVQGILWYQPMQTIMANAGMNKLVMLYTILPLLSPLLLCDPLPGKCVTQTDYIWEENLMYAVILAHAIYRGQCCDKFICGITCHPVLSTLPFCNVPRNMSRRVTVLQPPVPMYVILLNSATFYDHAWAQ
jgi:hypothetical protein